MTTQKTARIADFPVKSSRAAEFAPLRPIVAEPARTAEAAGWDPYEVWRTRVLMPRLQNHEPSEAPVGATPTVAVAK